MNNCEYFEKLVSDSHDEVDIGSEREALQLHILECKSCKEFQESVTNTAMMIHELGQAPVVQSKHSNNTLSPREALIRIWSWRIPVPAPLAAALVLSAALGWMLRPIEIPTLEQRPQQSNEQRLVSVVKLAPVSALRVDLNK